MKMFFTLISNSCSPRCTLTQSNQAFVQPGIPLIYHPSLFFRKKNLLHFPIFISVSSLVAFANGEGNCLLEMFVLGFLLLSQFLPASLWSSVFMLFH